MMKVKAKRIISLILTVVVLIGAIPLTYIPVGAVSEDEIVYGEGGYITRAEWLHDLAAVFDMKIESESAPDNYFSDIDDTHPYYTDILLTVEFGVVDIEAGEKLMPNEPVTRDFAVTTLNFCLGYQAKETDTYSFADYNDCTSPTAALVAVERGWVELLDGKFAPAVAVTSDEVKKMLDDAAEILKASDIDADYDSTYTFDENVIVVPNGTDVDVNEDSVIIYNSPVEIASGDRFAVYENDIPSVYEAVGVEISGVSTVITVKAVEDDDAFDSIDAQGQVVSGEMEFFASDGVKMEIDEISSDVSPRKAPGIRSIISSKKIKNSIKASTSLTLMPGVKAELSAKVNAPTINYRISDDYSYVTIEGDVTITYGIKGEYKNEFVDKSVPLFKCSVGGIGSFDVTCTFAFSGTAQGNVTGYLYAGIECRKGDRIRTITNFQQDEYYMTAEAETSIGVKVTLGVTKLPVVNAYLYAEIGAKANIKTSVYETAPHHCTHFAAYVYFKCGATASVQFGGWKTSISRDLDIFHEGNSPVKIVHHYENGIEVPSCTRGTSYNNFFTKWNSRYGGSGWTGASGAYGLAADGTPVALYEYELNNDGDAVIKKYNGNSYSVYIPSEIDGYTVVAVGSYAFEREAVSYVVIPDSVTDIDYRAFYNCKNLKKVVLSKSLTYLGGGAFENTAVEAIEIPKSLNSCGTVGTGYGFSYTFEGKEYGMAYTDIGPFAFCENLKTVTFEKGITKIPTNLFRCCMGIEEVTIPDTVTIIEASAFARCFRLKNVDYSSSITEIENSAFANCISLKDVSIPDSVTSIDYHAFYNCKNLKEVVLSKSLTYLGGSAFENTAVEAIEIPKSLNSCGTVGTGYGFSYTFEGKEYGMAYKYIGPFAFCENLKTVTFEKGVTKIPTNLFNCCMGIEEVTIPDTVTVIEASAFARCFRLKNVDCSSSITEIENSAFANCISLKDVSIPDSVCKIGNNSFENCFSLRTVKLPITLKTISQSMFYNCTSLKNIEIPTEVSIIQKEAFWGCASLENFSFTNEKSDLQEIGYSAFQNCTLLTEVIIPQSVQYIGSGAFKNCTSLTKAVIPQSTKTIGNSAFMGNELLADVEIADYSVTELEADVFKDCPSIKSIVLPKGLKKIGRQAFMNGTGLTEVTIPESVTDIDNTAFSYPFKTTIIGKSGSYAQAFADENGFNFVNGVTDIEGIILDDTTEYIVLDAGETYRASFEVYPEEANEVITLTADNYNVSVDGHDIYARYSGDTVITATASSGISYDFNIHIRNADKIEVLNPPAKTVYGIGESFDAQGMTVLVTYNDGSTAEINDFTVLGFDSSAEGECLITIKWIAKNGWTHETETTVNIIDMSPKLTGIFIDKLPDKLTYDLRERLDLTGLVVMASYTDGSVKEISDYNVSGYNALKKDIQTITVRADNYTCTFSVTVGEAAPKIGDIDGDGVVDAKDSNTLKHIILGTIEVGDKELAAADIDGDGRITTKDAFRLKRIMAEQ